MRRNEIPEPICIKFCGITGIRDVIMFFQVFWWWSVKGLGAAGSHILPIPIDFDRRPCNTLVLLLVRDTYDFLVSFRIFIMFLFCTVSEI